MSAPGEFGPHLATAALIETGRGSSLGSAVGPMGRTAPHLSLKARQHTLARAVGCEGIGLHSGRPVEMRLLPSADDSGIRFRRTDVPAAKAEIAARWDSVVDTKLCTVLGNRHGTRLATVEHLMAALSGAGIDNATIEIDGPEIPAMDGSAAPFLDLIAAAGTAEQTTVRRAVRILKPVSIEEGDKRVSLVPADEFRVGVAIDFPNRAIARQAVRCAVRRDVFRRDFAAARTFGFFEEVAELQAAGYARGGSLENAVVICGQKVMNPEGLRFPDEFVRHKTLDAIGDLYLAGAPILGQFDGVCSGHTLNNRLLRALFADPTAWKWEPEPAAAPNRGLH